MDKIILDGMGGDNAPKSTCEGAVQALKADSNVYSIMTSTKVLL